MSLPFYECPFCRKRLVDCDGRCAPQNLKLPHIESADCWCNPTIDYVDPETGVTVYVHRKPS